MMHVKYHRIIIVLFGRVEWTSVLWVNRGWGEVLMSHPCSREVRRVSSSPAAPLSPPARSERRSAAPAPAAGCRWPPSRSPGAGDPFRGRRAAASRRASRGRSLDSRHHRCGAARPRAPEPRGTRCSPGTARAGTCSGATGRGSGVSRDCRTWPRPAGSSRTFSSRAESFTLTELHLTRALAGARLFAQRWRHARDTHLSWFMTRAQVRLTGLRDQPSSSVATRHYNKERMLQQNFAYKV